MPENAKKCQMCNPEEVKTGKPCQRHRNTVNLKNNPDLVYDIAGRKSIGKG
jgi:hypothetical protein